MTRSSIMKKQSTKDPKQQETAILDTTMAAICEQKMKSKDKKFRKGVIAFIVLFAILIIIGVSVAIVLIVSFASKNITVAKKNAAYKKQLEEKQKLAETTSTTDIEPEPVQTKQGKKINYIPV